MCIKHPQLAKFNKTEKDIYHNAILRNLFVTACVKMTL